MRVDAVVGNQVYVESEVSISTSAKLNDGFSFENETVSIDVLAGSTLRGFKKRSQSAASVSQYFCTISTYARKKPANEIMFVCFGDENDDGIFDVVGPSLGKGLTEGNTYRASVPYEKGEGRFRPTGGFKNELIFQGFDGSVLRLSYREYINDMARPAFTQELTYTLDESIENEIQFRDLRMTVHSWTKNQIEYTTLSGFGSDK